jgi:3-phenylpropionate/cinnamic acid dioxygenase small subunit
MSNGPIVSRTKIIGKTGSQQKVGKSSMHNIEAKERVSMQLHYDVSQHYFQEATLLQDREFSAWLETFVAKDIHYWMPVVERRYVKDRREEPSPNDMAIVNDNYDELKQRVDRLGTGTVWMENPPSSVRYLITNVQAFHTDNEDELVVLSNFVIVRNRSQLEHSEHVGCRRDVLRKVGDGFQLAFRKITLDARVTEDKNLYIFF